MSNFKCKPSVTQDWLTPSEWLRRLEQEWISEIRAKGGSGSPIHALAGCSKDLELASAFANLAGMELKLIKMVVNPSIYGFFDCDGFIQAQFEGLGKEMIDWCKATAEARKLQAELNSTLAQGLSKRL